MTCNDSHAEVDIFDIFSSTSEDTHLEVWLQYKEQPVNTSLLITSLIPPKSTQLKYKKLVNFCPIQ